MRQMDDGSYYSTICSLSRFTRIYVRKMTSQSSGQSYIKQDTITIRNNDSTVIFFLPNCHSGDKRLMIIDCNLFSTAWLFLFCSNTHWRLFIV